MGVDIIKKTDSLSCFLVDFQPSMDHLKPKYIFDYGRLLTVFGVPKSSLNKILTGVEAASVISRCFQCDKWASGATNIIKLPTLGTAIGTWNLRTVFPV